MTDWRDESLAEYERDEEMPICQLVKDMTNLPLTDTQG
jgi:hypothetical protein